MAEWWVNKAGQNMLKGVEGDEDNPPRLTKEYILDFLTRIEAARLSFLRVFPFLTAEEQERLQPLFNRATVASRVEDPVTVSDSIQRKRNTASIRTTGRRGGTRIGGNR